MNVISKKFADYPDKTTSLACSRGTSRGEEAVWRGSGGEKDKDRQRDGRNSAFRIVFAFCEFVLFFQIKKNF